MENTGTAAPPLASQVDHLVVLAGSLAEGVQWCEATLGITPGPGGEHALMGTHNRLFGVSSAAFPQAYLEIIAIHSGAPCARPAGAKRWFDMDDQAIQLHLSRSGPQLAHFVASTSRAEAGARALARLGLDRGELLAASRMTPQGLLNWKITVREDGQRLFFGALPTLIQWGEIYPAQAMADSGVTLQSLQARHPRPDALRAAYQAIGLTGVDVAPGPPNLMATLQTPRGLVTLESKGI
ncbi:Glyoxalase-like domain-containing protein [Polaromonas sp. OV174]|uniref:VOC family protein n=1 Tax=Polaromonas sp. OV174 TaxID=1855300 RepID=UPI0008E7F55E|nr:VOC family protein [Polaromonas sp. OV174]SFC05332.1 Glyoxalase-like domain-containing protein [Polaromonas sp. OV174]